MVNIEEAKARALRAQDGMSYNREVLYREHISMAEEIGRWRAAFEKLKRDSPARETGGFAEAFGSFNDIFKR